MADSSTAPGTDDLQFDRAIDAEGASPGTPVCAKCSTPIRMYYYHVNGETTCSTCKQAVDVAAGAGRGRSGASMLKAMAYGLGAAIAGAFIYYAVMEYLDLEIGLVAILIGYMVGKAIHNATAGRGSRRFQVLAAGLTYLAVALAYAPFAIRGALESDNEVTADSSAQAGVLPLAAALSDSVDAAVTLASADSNAVIAPAEAADSFAIDTSTVAPEELGVGGMAFGIAGALLLILALPVIVIFTSMPSGLISAVIIGFGMHQAWGLTGGEPLSITGPFKIGGASPPATA